MPNRASEIMAGHDASMTALNQGQPEPQGAPGPDRNALRKIWDAIGDPRVQMWMLSAGNRLLNPQRGESQFARFGNAIQQGYEGLGASMIMQRERERRAGLEERTMQATEAAGGRDQQRVEQGQQQLNELKSHNVEIRLKMDRDHEYRMEQEKTGQIRYDETARITTQRYEETKAAREAADKLAQTNAEARGAAEEARVLEAQARLEAMQAQTKATIVAAAAADTRYDEATKAAFIQIAFKANTERSATQAVLGESGRTVKQDMEDATRDGMQMYAVAKGGELPARTPVLPKEAGEGRPGETRTLIHPKTGQVGPAQWTHGPDEKTGKIVGGWKFIGDEESVEGAAISTETEPISSDETRMPLPRAMLEKAKQAPELWERYKAWAVEKGIAPPSIPEEN